MTVPSQVPTQYGNVARQLRSGGCVRLELPVRELWTQYVHSFATQTLRQVESGGNSRTRSLDDLGPQMGQDMLSLDEWFATEHPRTWEQPTTIAELLKLAHCATDCASDTGGWRSEFEYLNELATEAEESIFERLATLIQTARREEGDAKALDVLNQVVRTLEDYRSSLQLQCESWTKSSSDLLRQHARMLIHLAQPRDPVKKMILKMWPDCPISRLFDRRKLRGVARAIDDVNRLLAVRHRHEVMRYKERVYDHLLGSDQLQGSLSTLRSPLRKSEQLFGVLSRLLQFDLRVPDAASSGCRVPVASSLQTVLESESRLTVEELFSERAKRAGCTPDSLAAMLRENGLHIGDAQVRPIHWINHQPARLAVAILQTVHDYLGSADPTRPINVHDPATALEHVAAINLLSAELRPRIKQLLSAAVDRARPYAEVHSTVGVDHQEIAFLYCHPEQRTTWETLLRTSVPHIQSRAAAACDLDNPWMIEIHQVLVSAAAGTSRQLWRWMSTGNRARRKAIVESLYDRRGTPECRLLAERIRDYQDCRALLNAARKASFVHELTGPERRLTLSHVDPRLEELFAPTIFSARWQPPEFFHELLRANPAFPALIQRVFPHLTAFRETATRLAGENDPDIVADQLEAMGILSRRSSQCRMNFTISHCSKGVPPGLYDKQSGPIVGLVEDEFVAELLRNDLLYTVIFCRVLDAYEQGWLGVNETPDSVIDMSRSLK